MIYIKKNTACDRPGMVASRVKIKQQSKNTIGQHISSVFGQKQSHNNF